MLSMLPRALCALVLAAAAALAAAKSAPPISAARPLPAPPQLILPAPAEAPVRLQAVKIDTELSGGQALTSVEMVFHNPNRRILEGELQFPLLDGQQVVGFALDIDGALREAVPVEKARGQQVFEDITRQRVDPGLLSQTAGNNYKLRIYPLPAQGQRRVVIRYSETLPVRGGQRLYRLPLAYAGTLDALSLHLVVRSPAGAPSIAGMPGEAVLVRSGSDYRADVERPQFAARGWLELRLPAPAAPEVRTQTRDGRSYFVAEVPVAAMAGSRRLPRVVGLLWDSSGSAAGRERAREFALLDAYFRRFGDGEVRLIRLRDSAEAAQSFSVRQGDWRALRKALETTPADGATDLGAFAPVAGVGEYLLFSDGLENYGEGRFPNVGVPVYAIGAAVRGDAARLRRIAERSGGAYIDLLAVTPAQAARSLLDAVPQLRELGGEGVSELVAVSLVPANGRLQVAGLLDRPDGRLKLLVARGARRQSIELPLAGKHASDGLAAATWARLRVAELEGEYRLHHGEIRRLGEQFRLVTRATSLIVLDRADDYARHGIEAPAGLKAEVERLRRAYAQRGDDERQRHLEQLVRRFEEKRAWWAKEFPKDKPVAAGARDKQESRAANGVALGRVAEAERDVPAAPLAAARKMAAPSALPASAADAVRRQEAGNGIAIQLKPWSADAPYATRLRHAAADDLYSIYLDERSANAGSTAFFLDVADLFFERGQRELGLRVLSNLAEMDLENRHILRILGYRLLQAGAAAQAVPILDRVRELAPNEPQSWRDLGLAHAALGNRQNAVDHLAEVVLRPWHGRFPDVELIALAELNAIVATSDTPLDTRRIDARLLANLPLDLRVVLSWDADNTDIDLWVTDPNNERAYYGNRLSYQGGRMSADFTGGYGPEEFSLKTAKPGKYKVEANFFGHRQQIVAGATTLQLRLATKFGSREMQEKSVTLRLKDRGGVVFVGEFEVK